MNDERLHLHWGLYGRAQSGNWYLVSAFYSKHNAEVAKEQSDRGKNPVELKIEYLPGPDDPRRMPSPRPEDFAWMS